MEEVEACSVALTLAKGDGRGDQLRLDPVKRSSELRPEISTVARREEEASVSGTGGGCGRIRKKLRFSEEQLAVLEDNFRAHTTLAPDQKQELALRLEMQPRQVEVWFQNRRARTKLKKTEVDCELLKKHCEGLRSENRRLKRELLELRSAAPAKLGGLPLFAELQQAAKMMICSACDKTMRSSCSAGDEKLSTPKHNSQLL